MIAAHPQSDVVDLCIRVRFKKSKGRTRLLYNLNSPSKAASFHYKEIAGPVFDLALDDLRKKIFSKAEKLHNGVGSADTPLFAEEALRSLHGMGRDLYRDLFGPSMRLAYRRFRRKVRTIQIISTEPGILWELIKPYEDDFDDDFLCLRFQLTQWLTGVAPLPGRISARSLAYLEADQSPMADKLLQADSERRMVQEFAKRCGLRVDELKDQDAVLKKVTDFFKMGSFQLLHVVAHGKTDPERANQSMILLNDGTIWQVANLHGRIQSSMRRNRPLVFFNLCQAARTGWSLGGFGGWAERLIKQCCCCAFIAPQWSVRDHAAQQFAEDFYVALEQGQTFGQAGQTARIRGIERDPANLSWLAYTIYAHPHGRLARGNGEGSHFQIPASFADGNVLLLKAVDLYTGAWDHVDEQAAKRLICEASQDKDCVALMWRARCLHRGRCLFACNVKEAQLLACSEIDDIRSSLIDEVQQQADQGDLEAAFVLASAFQEGLGTERDLDQAASWYERAADGDHLLAMANLARLHETGQHPCSDLGRAVSLYREAADRGCVFAMLRLGRLLEAGKGMARNVGKALQCYEGAAKRNCLSAMEAAGRLLARESDGFCDPERALGYLQDAAELRRELVRVRPYNVLERRRLAGLYLLSGDLLHRRLEADGALVHYREAANWGSSTAASRLAEIFDPTGKGDIPEAQRWRGEASKKKLLRFLLKTLNGKPVALYVTTPEAGKEVLEDEEERLLKEHGISLPPKIKQDLTQLYAIAQRNQAPFPDLCLEVFGKEALMPEADGQRGAGPAEPFQGKR